MTHTKKLIEVALPLDDINAASAREKSIRHGHPSTLHLWWARRPLAAARAVIFAQMVDDPSEHTETLLADPARREAAEAELEKRRKKWIERKAGYDEARRRDDAPVPPPGPEPTLEQCVVDMERERLFDLVRRLVLWENTTNEEVLGQAREEILKSWRHTCEQNRDHPRARELFDPDKLPAFHDPFAGGGALPLEAQRLGLESYAGDLNPVAVLINKAMIEIPPKFAGCPPVNPESRRQASAFEGQWKGARGLAEDVRYYGKWMRDEAEKRIGHLYPKVEVTPEMAQDRPDLKKYAGRRLTVIAWLWARTVKSPNPAFAHVDVPLVSNFMLSTKKGKEAYVEPVVEGDGYRFAVKTGKPADVEAAKRGTKVSRGSFRCLFSGVPVLYEYIDNEANAGRMGARLMAVVAEGDRCRVYLPPTEVMEDIARQARPEWKPEVPSRGTWASNAQGRRYGFRTYGDYFTPRQLVALTTFSDLIREAREKVKADALEARDELSRAGRPHSREGAPVAEPPVAEPPVAEPPGAEPPGAEPPGAKPPGAEPPGAEPLGARASRPRNPWHRSRLPHFEAGETPQHIIFRLADSLSAEVFARWEAELARLPEDERAAEKRKRIEAHLDQGHGSCALGDPRIAEIVENALLHFDGSRYLLHEWVVMPNHVHVLITPLEGNTLSSILNSWKSFTAKQANRILGRKGAFWQEDYFDRVIRDERHWATAVAYVIDNPVKAGLCPKPEQWRFGSAWKRELAFEEEKDDSRERGHLALVEMKGDPARARRPRSQDGIPLAEGGAGVEAYADAVATYLGIALSRLADICNSLCGWEVTKTQVRHLSTRHAIPMMWDFAENNVFGQAAGDYAVSLANMVKALERVSADRSGIVRQEDAQTQSTASDKLVSTDPPYYDNIGYADLSDFFYVWLRRSLKPVFPDLFATLAVPKAEELVATPYRHGSKEKAETFFLEGMTQAMRRLAEQSHSAFPVTIYYAFKQSESKGDTGTASTGWETFLDAVIRSRFSVSGTWPMRTELGNRMIGSGTNALASSVILVCRKRPADAPAGTRRAFIAALKSELPEALARLQRSNIAPVDLAQAAIGPGMAVYTRYNGVLDAEGKPLSVRDALALINQVLEEALAEQEGDFDAESRWALAWFEQSGFNEGPYGTAETLSKAKNTSVAGMVEAGIVASKGGKVSLLRPEELAADWDPAKDKRLAVWEVAHQLVRALETGGEGAAADLAAKLGPKAELAHEMAYRLYTLCERKKWAREALAYNALVRSWPEITRLARADGKPYRQL